MFDKVIWHNSWIKLEYWKVELLEKFSILFVFKVITKYFQYEHFFFYLGPIPIYKTGLKEPVKSRVAVNLLRKKNFSYSIFSIWVFFHEHSRITGVQGKGEGVSLTPH